MKLGPKYKIARRLGAPVFEKTQTQKYALSLARKERTASSKRPKAKSEFAKELTEKQKARFTYGLSETQFRAYVLSALKASDPVQKLFSKLESRLDNVLYRSCIAKTRSQARQIASHGHALVNGRKVTIPSILLKKGDVVSLREGSASSPLFGEVSERMKSLTPAPWLKVDPSTRTAEILGEAVYTNQENVFDLGVVVEFYSR